MEFKCSNKKINLLKLNENSKLVLRIKKIIKLSKKFKFNFNKLIFLEKNKL